MEVGEVVLKNTAHHILAIPLNSGRTIQMAPGEATKPLRKLEVTDNWPIEKLKVKGCISIMEQEDVGSATGRTKKKEEKKTES